MGNAVTLVQFLLLVPCWCSAQTPATADRTAPNVLAQPNQGQNRPYAPLTEKKRLHEYMKSWLSPVSFLTCAASAGWGQLRDAPYEWGEGDGAFGIRFVSAYGQHLVNSTLLLTGASLLHEDNRYVPSGEFDTRERIKYALESSLVTRHDDANGHSHRRVSFSRIVAFAGAAAVSRAWQPPSSRGFNHAAISFGSSVAVTAGFNLVREFLNFK